MRTPCISKLLLAMCLGVVCLVGLILVLSCLVPGGVQGQTLSSHKALGRYQQLVWQDQHGLPSNSISAMVRTRDGYLWLATLEGAARFDGVRFTVFDNSNTPDIGVSAITSLVEDRAGNLWLGTFGGGLLRRTDGGFIRYTTAEGLTHNTVRSLLEDRDGNLWIGTEGGGLNRFRDGRFTAYTTRDGLPDDSVMAITEAPEGGLWLGTHGGLAWFKDGRFTTWTTRDGMPHNAVDALCQDRAGHFWLGTEDGLARFSDGHFTVYDKQDRMARDHVWAIYQDQEGSLWIGTNRSGLFQFSQGRFSAFTTRDGLPGDIVRSIYQDPDGDLWVDTIDGGLCQFRAGRFSVFTTQDGLPHDFANAIFEDSRGNVWMGTRGGFGRLKDGAITSYTTKDGLPENGGGAIAEDRAGNLWVNTRGKLSQYNNGRFTPWTSQNGLPADTLVTALLGDRAGNLWIGTQRNGLLLFRAGRFTAWTTQDGLAAGGLTAIYEDRAGSLWIGTGNGISRFKDGRFTTWTTKDGLASNHILSFYEDRNGSLWIGTHGSGLNRFKDGKFTTITANDGLYDNLAFQILSDTEDDSGDLWMSCNRGIYRASLKELNDFADGRIRSVTSFAYGVADGMLSRECNGGSPAGWKTRDGRLWFPTIKGVVVVDPTRRNTQLSLAALERVLLDRAPLPAGQQVRIRPGQENLEIEYTGLNWSHPERIRFKYQMAGLDHDWVEAGTRRTAYYSHLPPGDYTFKVIVDNGDGVWNTEGKSLRVVVLPPFYRTWWFRSLAALGLIGAVWLSVWYRIRQLHRARAAQEKFSRRLISSQESERKRIAVELHDSLGQSLVLIRNWALLGAGQLDAAAPAKEELDEITAVSSRAINEVREIAYNLGPYHLDRLGLANSIKEMVNRVAKVSPIRFSIEVVPLDGALSREAEMCLYRVTQESLNNLVKHSEATEARVTIEREPAGVKLTIADNGKGFNSQVDTSSANHRGFGLTGMAERVRLLDGSWAIQSAPGRGTTIEVRLNSKVDM